MDIVVDDRIRLDTKKIDQIIAQPLNNFEIQTNPQNEYRRLRLSSSPLPPYDDDAGKPAARA